ncbi:MAG: hypothetical protein JWO06_2896 [Bacteroidota bacterium]|nr:hypothetical protein [Bacteroidota bacterium]
MIIKVQGLKNMKLLVLLFLTGIFGARAQNSVPTDSTAQYYWINWQLNGLQYYDRSSLEHFYQSWKETNNRKLVIVDLGDSHLQSDIYPGQMRRSFQQAKGDGGRGMMFCYSAAKTYSPTDYSTSHTGDWAYGKAMILPAKVPLGVSGMSCRTSDATASLTFKFKDDVPTSYTRLKLFVKKQPNSFDLLVDDGGPSKLVNVASYLYDTTSYIEIEIPPINRSITLRVRKSDASQNELEFYGMSLETNSNNGVVLHNGGVGGARYQSILYEDMFEKQLNSLMPDLVIIDFGTNDYLYDDSIKPEFEGEIRDVVKRVRNAAPAASIILTTAHDLFWKGRNVRSGQKFADLVYKIAKEQQCAIYDWYWIFGGRKAMLKWSEAGIGRPDKIHLTQKGYVLKGQLFYQAIRHAINRLDTSTANAFLFNLDSLKQQQAQEALLDTTPEPKPQEHALVSSRVHVVKKGETLNIISRKYGVAVSKIMKLNGLKSSYLGIGQKLAIPKK